MTHEAPFSRFAAHLWQSYFILLPIYHLITLLLYFGFGKCVKKNSYNNKLLLTYILFTAGSFLSSFSQSSHFYFGFPTSLSLSYSSPKHKEILSSLSLRAKSCTNLFWTKVNCKLKVNCKQKSFSNYIFFKSKQKIDRARAMTCGIHNFCMK